MDELSCRCAKFTANVLDSDSDVVSYVVRHFDHYGWVLSLKCCSRHDDVLSLLMSILTVRCLLELLYVRHGLSSLSLFTRDELARAISHLSTG